MIPYAGAMVSFIIALVSYFKGYMFEYPFLTALGFGNLYFYIRLRKIPNE